MISSKIELAIITVSYNCISDLAALIASVDSYLCPELQLFIVDNNSDNETKEFIRDIQHPYITSFLLEENIGFGCANNVVFEKIDAESYFLLNLDAYVVDDKFINAIDLLQRNKDIGVIGLPLVYPDGSTQSYFYSFSTARKWLLQLFPFHRLISYILARRYLNFLLFFVRNTNYVKRHFSSAREETGVIQDVDWVCGASMVISKACVRATGGFDPNIFLYGEDEDFCIAAHKLNFRVVSYDICKIVHRFGWGSNGKDSVFVSSLKYKSLKYFVRKNTNSKVKMAIRLLVLPFHVFGLLRFYRCFRA